MNIPRWSLERPALIILGTIAITIFGIITYFDISRREDPEFRIATALVVTVVPGEGAERVEQQVTSKLEDAIATMSRLKTQISTSLDNLSVIKVTVDYDADTDTEWQRLRSKVNEKAQELPSTIRGPMVWDTFGDTSVMILVLHGAPILDLAAYAEDLKDQLRQVSSIADIDLLGMPEEAIYVETTKAQFSAYPLTPMQLATAIRARNLSIPAGRIRTKDGQLRVEVSGRYDRQDEIERTVLDVSKENGRPTYLGDLFNVRRGLVDPPATKLLYDGDSVVAISLTMKSGMNVINLGRDVEKVLKEFRNKLPEGVSLDTLHDSPTQVDREVSSFMNNLFQGLAVVVVAMAIFLGLRAAIISAAAIPLSVLFALCLMPLLDVALEKVSIAAFIIALGMLVDNSIIVVDNIDVKLRQGYSRKQAAWRGAQELILPVITGTMATVIAFFPMLLLSAEIGAYVRSLPLVVGVSLIGSLIFSVTFTPLAAVKLMPRPKAQLVLNNKQKKENIFERAYRKIMRVCLKLRWLVFLGFGAALAGSVALVFVLGMSFFPNANRDQFTVDIWLKEGASFEETEAMTKEVDEFLHQDKDVKSTLAYIGKGGPRFYITVVPEFNQSNYAQIMVNTKDPLKTDKVVERVEEYARTHFEGANIFAHQLLLGLPVDAAIGVRIVGPELETLKSLSHQVKEILRSTPGADRVRDSFGSSVPAMKVDVDVDRAYRVGVTNSDVALAFLSSYEGFELTRLQEGDTEIPVKLRLVDEERTLVGGIDDLPVSSTVTSERVPLGSIAELNPKYGTGVIKHYQTQRYVSVLAEARGRLPDHIINDAWPKIQAIPLPPGYHIDMAGEREKMAESLGELINVFFIILTSIGVLMLLQFKSLKATLVILLSVPLAMIGASLGLLAGGYSFSFMAFLGIVSLAGMVIKNAVVWMEHVQQVRVSGMSRDDAVIDAGLKRMRPIMLTAVTTVGGLIPLALFGGVLFEPMAWAMVVGLALSTALILILLPVFYVIIYGNSPAVPVPEPETTMPPEIAP